MKKYLNADGIWKSSFENFDENAERDFWLNINGHDVLWAIKYFNPEVENAYRDTGFKRNVEFEKELIAFYDYDCVKKTKLYEKMVTAEIINVTE